jgi:hypothetical protein
MPDTTESQRVANASRTDYDVQSAMRLSAIETRSTAVEADVTVTKSSCSTRAH